MNFQIVNSQAIYRRLLATPDAASRERIFKDELIEPFQGIVDIFGGDGIAAYKNWGMWPDQFTGEAGYKMSALLDTLTLHHAWERSEQALHKGWAAFAKYTDRIPTEKIVFGLLLAELMPQSGGYSGFGSIPGWIMTVYGDATEDNLKKVEALTVHEMHHNLSAASGSMLSNWATTSVGEYMLAEGLAESFAAELYGEDMIGPWVTDFDEAQLDPTRRLFRDALAVTGSGIIRSYIFGSRIAGQFGLPAVADIPDYAGYALGYRMAQAYLKRTGKSVADATFTPIQEIIAESRFFA
jgi:uncharacterized protein YjaZ